MPSQSPAYNSIEEYAEKQHKTMCPCTLKAVDFQNHNPETKDDNPINFLLLHKIEAETAHTSEQWTTIVRNHFLILAQKYHPDKNPKTSQALCHEIMTKLNNSYHDMIHKTHGEDDNKKEIIDNGKIYRKINSCTVTCKHHDSFSVYGFPDDVIYWRTQLKQLFSVSPSPIKVNGKTSGQQFGFKTDSIYVSIYDNGTIFIQGIMATQYSEEVIIPLLPKLPPRPLAQQNRFSKQLRSSMGLFTRSSSVNTNSNKTQKDKEPLKQLMKQPAQSQRSTPDLTEASDTSLKVTSVTLPVQKTQETTTSIKTNTNCSRDLNTTADSCTLDKILQRLDMTEQKITHLESTNERDQNSLLEALARIDKLEKELTAVKKENKQLKEQSGPKISELTKQLDHMKYNLSSSQQSSQHQTHPPMNSRTETSHHQTPNPSTFASHARNLRDSNMNRQITPKSVTGRTEFNREKCFVISDIQDKDQTKTDDKIRRVVGKAHKVIIDRISRSRNGKIFVQLSDTDKVAEVVNAWDINNFGGSTTSQSQPPQKKFGILKGVPFDILDEEIKTTLTNAGYNNTEIKRIQRNGKPTRAIKVQFDNTTDLEKAINNNITIDNLIIRVEEMSMQPRVIQCFNCFRFNHIQDRCRSSKTCPTCSELYDETHDSCNKEVHCINCNGPHASTDRQCPLYLQMVDIQKIRLSNLYNRNNDAH